MKSHHPKVTQHDVWSCTLLWDWLNQDVLLQLLFRHVNTHEMGRQINDSYPVQIAMHNIAAVQGGKTSSYFTNLYVYERRKGLRYWQID